MHALTSLSQIGGRDFIGIDLNAEYVKVARRRIEGTAPLFVEVAS
jgi:DNA modification methylase